MRREIAELNGAALDGAFIEAAVDVLGEVCLRGH